MTIINGTTGPDLLEGTSGNDTIDGGAGDDTIIGGAGNDSLTGGDGLDVFRITTRDFGTDVITDFQIGFDRLDLAALNVGDLATLLPYLTVTPNGTSLRLIFNGRSESVLLRGITSGGQLSDASFIFNTSTAGLTVTGTPSRDILFGGNGNDRLEGLGGNDDLNGGLGNDTLIGGRGDDRLRGGGGADVFVLDGREFGDDTIEDFVLGVDRLDVSALNVADFNQLRPYFFDLADATLLSLAFNQQFEGVFLNGVALAQLGNANFIFNTSTQGLTVEGTFASDILFGGNGNDRLSGGGGNDDLNGGGGDDTLEGGTGSDRLDGGPGADVLNGGDGIDRAWYQTSPVGITLDLGNPANSTGDAAGDTYISIEQFGGTLFADRIIGSSAADVAFGLGGDDTIEGGDGADTLNGGDGNDLILGGAGADLLFGEFGDDTINGGADNDEIRGGTGNDVLIGGDGDDFLLGEEGDDALIGNAGNDTLAGGDGDDMLTGEAGADRLDGGAGFDTASYRSSLAAVVVNLANPALNTGDAAGDVLIGIEAIEGTPFNDRITGDGGNNTLIGRGGADTLDGGAGQDRVSYRGAPAGVTAFLGSVALNTGEAAGDEYANIEILQGSDFADILGVGDTSRIVGLTGSIGIEGGGGNDLIFGTGPFGSYAGNDFLFGQDGDDTIDGQGGADFIDGGPGIDTVSFASARAGVAAFLDGAEANSGDAAGDVYFNIENITGSGFDDRLGGNQADNAISGGDGNDTLFGRGGADVLDGGNGDDVLDGGDGNDFLVGGAGNDSLRGGAGNDVLVGGPGADRFEGGSGADVAFYRNVAAGIVVNMANPGLNTGEAVGDTFADDVENLWGSDFDDVLTGSAIGGQVYGFAGNDRLIGQNGNDVFYGGLGSDTITTGGGADDIFFLRFDGAANEGGDTITDFQSGVDRITVSRFFFGFGNIGGPAAALTSANAGFVAGGAATDARPTFLWNPGNGQLSFDPDGSGSAAAVLLVTLQPGAALQLSDIWTA